MTMEQPSADTLKVILSGQWKLVNYYPWPIRFSRGSKAPGVRNLVFDTRELAYWDTGLLIFLKELNTFCSRQKIDLNYDGLPEGAKKLLELASVVPETKDARPAERGALFSFIWAKKPSISFNQPGK